MQSEQGPFSKSWQAAGYTMLDDFRNNVIHMIGGMASMGYVKRKIDSQFSKFANRFSSRYGKHSLKLIETEVKRVLQTMSCTAQAATQPTPREAVWELDVFELYRNCHAMSHVLQRYLAP